MEISFNKVNSITEAVSHDTRLNSSEIGNLWSTYMIFSMLSCVKKHFYKNVEDKDIRSIVEFALEIANTRVSKIMEIFHKEDIPIPIGFSDEDLDLKAPRLYSDIYYLYFLKYMNRFILPLGSKRLATSTRSDIREFYSLYSLSSMKLFERISNISQSKGLYVKSPYITINKDVDFIKKQTFLRGFLGKKRPLLVQEIASLFYAVKSNYVGKCLLLGFRQVARSKQVHDYINRGIDLADKIIDSFSMLLKNEDLPVSMIWDTMVTDSVTPPFSDKLMMFHIVLLNQAGLAVYETLLADALRHDLTANIISIMPEGANYAEDGINIMIENGWLEEPPRLVDRRELTNFDH